MLYRAKADCGAADGGTGTGKRQQEKQKEQQKEQEKHDQVFERVCKLMARALHPGTPPEESAVSMRLARVQMMRHQMDEAAVVRRMQQHQRGEQHEGGGGLFEVALVECTATSAEAVVSPAGQRWWWEVAGEGIVTGGMEAAQAEPKGGRGRGSSSSGSDTETDTDSDTDSGSDPEFLPGNKRKRQGPLPVEQYVSVFVEAIRKFACVEVFFTKTRERCVVTFYGPKAQAKIAAYQLEVALDTATHHVLQLGEKVKATERADYMMGFAVGLGKKVALMMAASVRAPATILEPSQQPPRQPPQEPPRQPPQEPPRQPPQEPPQQPPQELPQEPPQELPREPPQGTSGGGGVVGAAAGGGGVVGAAAPGVIIKTEKDTEASAATAGSTGPSAQWQKLKDLPFRSCELTELRRVYLHNTHAGSQQRTTGRSTRPCYLHWLHFPLWKVLTRCGADKSAATWPREDLLFVLRCVKYWELVRACIGPLPHPLRVLVEGTEEGPSDMHEIIVLTAVDPVVVDLTVEDIAQYAVDVLFVKVEAGTDEARLGPVEVATALPAPAAATSAATAVPPGDADDDGEGGGGGGGGWADDRDDHEDREDHEDHEDREEAQDGQIVLWQRQSELTAAAVLEEHHIKLRKGRARKPLKRKMSHSHYRAGRKDGMEHQLCAGALPT